MCWRSLFLFIACLLFISGCADSSRKRVGTTSDVSADMVAVQDSQLSEQDTLLQPGDPGMFSERSTAAGQSYILYLPKQYRVESRFPVILFFDPQGNGNLPVHRYARLADEAGFILAGSNQVKNGLGMDVSTELAADLAASVLKKLGSTHSGLFLCGFSGGAKVALLASGGMRGATGVIHCGAGLPSGIPAPSLPTLGVTGQRDMNYAEVIDFVNRSAQQPGHHLIVTPGRHEWPDVDAMRFAFSWCAIQSCKAAGPCDQEPLQSFERVLNDRIASEKDLPQKMRLLRCGMELLTNRTPVHAWDKRINRLSQDAAYSSAILEDSRKLSTELNRRQFLIDALRSREIVWWNGVIGDLRKQTNEPMNDRLLGYISLACYSLSKQASEQGDLQEVARLNRIYRLVDPANSEANYMAAVLFAQAGARDSSVKYLKESIRNGFHETNRFDTEESFRNLFSEGERSKFRDQIEQNQSAW